MDGRLGLQHVGDAVGGDGGARQDDEHHRQHQEGEDDLHGILHEGHHVAHLHVATAATWCAPTQMISSDHAVHDQHHDRHHDHHDAVDEQAGAGQVLVGLVEAVLLEVLHVEGADDHHARQVLAGHQVEPVDQVLDDLELGQGDREDGQDQAEQDDHGQGDDPPHGGALCRWRG